MARFMKFKSQQTYDKLRGGYYTPTAVVHFLTRWALRNGASSLLEPSCGDGRFLDAAVRHPDTPRVIHGVEVDPHEAAKARDRLNPSKAENHRVFAADFLQFVDDANATYDAVVGNPPYIRYQFLESEIQELARALYAKHDLPFTRHLNAWAPFVVDSLDRMSPGGRLGMILPAELLTVIHAGGVRRFLLGTCSRILVIDPQALIFDEALQGTVLVLAEKKLLGVTGRCGLAIIGETDTVFLDSDPEHLFADAVFVPQSPSEAKWMNALLTTHEQSVLEHVAGLEHVHRFGEVATVSVGIVTGANKFFLVPDDVVERYELEQFAHPMFGRSYHCRGVVYSEELHDTNGANGFPTNFLDFGTTPFYQLPAGAQRYILDGEAELIHTRYKCRIREPWYSVPSVWSTRLSLLKRCHELPRVIVNELEAYTTDTAYRIETDYPPATLAVGFVNSLTALTAELRGRAYGGGVLELVPSEIRSLLVPLVDASDDDLRALDGRFHDGDDVDTILEIQDKTVLTSAGLTDHEIEIIQSARIKLRNRRLRNDRSR